MWDCVWAREHLKLKDTLATLISSAFLRLDGGTDTQSGWMPARAEPPSLLLTDPMQGKENVMRSDFFCRSFSTFGNCQNARNWLHPHVKCRWSVSREGDGDDRWSTSKVQLDRSGWHWTSPPHTLGEQASKQDNCVPERLSWREAGQCLGSRRP